MLELATLDFLLNARDVSQVALLDRQLVYAKEKLLLGGGYVIVELATIGSVLNA